LDSPPTAVLSSVFVSRRSLPLLLSLSTLAACGGGGGGGGTSGPTPVQPTFSVTGAVFYDENGNGTLDAGENTRVPDVTVEAGTRSGRSSKVLGEFTIDGVPGGAQAVTLRRATLPPYCVPPASTMVSLPQSQPLLIPVTLPIGSRNRPNVYMAFGDSISIGQGSSDDHGYATPLEAKLAAHFGRGMVVREGVDATRSNRGAERIDESLGRARPAYTLILYGTNDWNVGDCKFSPPCFTIDSLRDIVLSARGSQSLPVLSTIIPGDPKSLQQPDRNDWVAAMDMRIRALGREMNVPVADPQALFVKSPSFDDLFVDHVHPNGAGYELIAQAFFTAIATPLETSGSAVSPLSARPRASAPPAVVAVGARP
jgi:lysophospholipase L1-like esterase